MGQAKEHAKLVGAVALWIAGLGIDMRWIRPSTPKDNPQIERCNRLIDDWSEPHTCASLAVWQTRLDQMVQRQRDDYPVQDGLSRTKIHPEFYAVSRPYRRDTEMETWQLTHVKKLLAQFSWQRVVSSTGQITMMNQRFSVGSSNKGRTVQVRYDATNNTYVVTTLEGALICTQHADDITTDTIMSLASTASTRRKSKRQHKHQTCGASD